MITTARNGPYLVTNVPAVRMPLGDRLTAPPQLALCRCGGSAMKPFCDATCASNGFTGAKDPNRVRDRRDTYPGQQLTIFDNRGICQHSGFCLWSQADLQAHAAAILERLRNGTMPCDSAWPAGKIEVFQRWAESGFQP